jgi:hypothetical protein
VGYVTSDLSLPNQTRTCLYRTPSEERSPDSEPESNTIQQRKRLPRNQASSDRGALIVLLVQRQTSAIRKRRLKKHELSQPTESALRRNTHEIGQPT